MGSCVGSRRKRSLSAPGGSARVGWFTFSTETPAMSALRVRGLRLGFRNTLVSNSGNRSGSLSLFLAKSLGSLGPSPEPLNLST